MNGPIENVIYIIPVDTRKYHSNLLETILDGIIIMAATDSDTEFYQAIRVLSTPYENKENIIEEEKRIKRECSLVLKDLLPHFQHFLSDHDKRYISNSFKKHKYIESEITDSFNITFQIIKDE